MPKNFYNFTKVKKFRHIWSHCPAPYFHFCFRHFLNLFYLHRIQCDQTAILLFQYLTINSKENLPNRIRSAQKLDTNDCQILIRPFNFCQILSNFCQNGKILQNLVALIASHRTSRVHSHAEEGGGGGEERNLNCSKIILLFLYILLLLFGLQCDRMAAVIV